MIGLLWVQRRESTIPRPSSGIVSAQYAMHTVGRRRLEFNRQSRGWMEV